MDAYYNTVAYKLAKKGAGLGHTKFFPERVRGTPPGRLDLVAAKTGEVIAEAGEEGHAARSVKKLIDAGEGDRPAGSFRREHRAATLVAQGHHQRRNRRDLCRSR